jgi:hypothetical protein
MNADKPTISGRSQNELEEAMRQLSITVRKAGECMLDLQQAVEALKLANEPGLARAIEREAKECLRTAMQRW